MPDIGQLRESSAGSVRPNHQAPIPEACLLPSTNGEVFTCHLPPGRGCSTRRRRRTPRISEAHEPIRSLDEASNVGRRNPFAVEARQVVLGHPTGDRTSLSDVDRYAVLDCLGEELLGRRQSDALQSSSHLGLHQLRGVPGEDEANRVSHLQ